MILATFLLAKNFSLVGKHIWVQTWALKTERLRERERQREEISGSSDSKQNKTSYLHKDTNLH